MTFIIGAGGHGREIFDIYVANGKLSSDIKFLDDRLTAWDALAHAPRGSKIAERWIDHRGIEGAEYALGVGDSALRAQFFGRIQSFGGVPAKIVSRSAVISECAVLGEGVVVFPNCFVSTNVRIGVGSVLNVGCSVSHDVVVGSFSTLSPGVRLTGGVKVGDHIFFGTGAIVAPGVQIGDGAIVGAGAVVLKDVAAGTFVKGVPAG